MSIFPWQKKQWQQLIEAKNANHLPHALLFTGLQGMGKASFALQFARALLCQQPTSEAFACDACHACRLQLGGVHPNVIQVRPETAGHPIKVDQIREAGEFVCHSALQGQYRIVLIDPANNMNINAANALLKTLEEPPADVVIILISDQRHRLPATILSRCQQVSFARPPMHEALQWLETKALETKPTLPAATALRLTDGAPLAALQLIKADALLPRDALFQAIHSVVMQKGDPIKLAATFQAMDSIVFIDFMLRFIQDCLRLQLGDELEPMEDKASVTQLLDITAKISRERNIKLLDQLQAMRKQISQGINLNKQLVVENTMLAFLE